MKRFLKRVLAFAVYVLLLCAAFEIALLFQDNEYAYKRRYVEEHGDAIKVLILGHSHAALGLNPEFLGDSVFNMAISGRKSYYDAVLAKRYVQKLRHLQVVIMPYGYNHQYGSNIYRAVYDNGNQLLSPTYQCMYEKYMGISNDPNFPYSHWSELLNSRLDYVGRFFKNGRDKRMCELNGFAPNLEKKSKDWQYKKMPGRVNLESPNTQLAFQEGIHNFQQIAAMCKQADVRLVVICTPCYHTARERFTERGLREKTQVIDSMRSVYPQMEFLDYVDDSRFTDDDFCDASHLTLQGANKFSRILKDTLNL